MSREVLHLLKDTISGEGAQRLVDQFNAELNRSYSSLSGSVGFDSEGLYRTEARVFSDSGPYQGRLTWILRRAVDGSVVSVTVSGEGAQWRESAEEFFRQVLSNALADRQEIFPHRKVFQYFGPLLGGEYWFGNVRVAPLHPDDDSPRNTNLERVLVIDHEVTAPDRTKAYLLGDEKARRHGARVAFFLDAGLRSQERRHRWVTIRGSDGAVEHVRGEAGVVTDDRLDHVPEKGQSCPMGLFEGRTHIFGRSGPLTFPEFSRPVWRASSNAPIAVRHNFDAMCQLYHVGLVIEEHYPSAATAYFVAAAEAASAALDSGSSFGEFMRRFSPPVAEREQLIERLYGELRSGHFHAGRFPLGDYKPRGTTFVGDVDEELRGNFYVEGRKLLRSALTSWAETQIAGAF